MREEFGSGLLSLLFLEVVPVKLKHCYYGSTAIVSVESTTHVVRQYPSF